LAINHDAKLRPAGEAAHALISFVTLCDLIEMMTRNSSDY